jgi:hypothetical protein
MLHTITTQDMNAYEPEDLVASGSDALPGQPWVPHEPEPMR